MISISICTLLFAALFALAFLAQMAGYSGLLLVTPASPGSEISFSTVQRLQDEGLLVTYEISDHAVAEAANARHSVIRIGTNSTYLDITGHRLLSGGFFPRTSHETGSRLAVLNETAAITLFGSINIDGMTLHMDGESWSITGVINDFSGDNLNIYTQNPVTGGSIRSLLIQKCNGGAIHAAHILSTAGIREGEYIFTNLSKVSNAFAQRFTAAWKLLIIFTVVLLWRVGLEFTARIFSSLKDGLKHLYPRELIVYRKAYIAKIIMAAALMFVGILVTLHFSLDILAMWLIRQDISLPPRYADADFAYKIQWLHDYHTLGVWVFKAYIFAALTSALSIGIGEKRSVKQSASSK